MLPYVEFWWKELFAEEDAVAGEVQELLWTPVVIMRALTSLLHTSHAPHIDVSVNDGPHTTVVP